MRGMRPFVKACTVLALAAIVWGCSSKNDSAPPLDASGHHPAGWIVAGTGGDHPAAFLNNSIQCSDCHGKDLTGGISKVSCFSSSFAGIACHPNGPSGHPAGFADPDFHGAQAKATLDGANGFAFCQKCHGTDFGGGIVNTSCFTCHGVNAPHSPKPWTGAVRTHVTTDASNAPVCAGCHTAGANLSPELRSASYATGAPGCFNNTLCHGQIGHPAEWRDPLQHGAKAKGQPGEFSGFASCRVAICHGANFTGGGSGVSCFVASRNGFSCHGVNAPHAPAPWRTSPSPTHTTTVDDAAGSNAAVCALCHANGNAGTPSCFNNTLCHGVPSGGAGHSLPYAQPASHGIPAMSNLTYCQSCHATPATGGAGSNPRFNIPLGRLVNGCESCHVPFAAHPPTLPTLPAVFGNITALNPLGTPWYLHCQTNPSGFDGCRLCHGATLGGGPNGASACTSCHRNGVPSTIEDCATCHGNPPNGTTYPNIAAAHTSHNSGTIFTAPDCGECHQGLGSVSLDHYNRAQSWRAGATSVQPSAVQFGSLARSGGASPVFNATTQQCTNTYCHGATITGGTNKSPIWGQTDYLTAAGCGTCHGFPPPSPHPTSTACSGCHPDVNAANNGIKDPARHVNGFINISSAGGGGGVAPHPIPLLAGGYPGSVHNSVAGAAPFSGCTVCHSNSSANRGVYPVASGTPPDCQGCHVKSGPNGSPTTGCYSCHGSSTNSGRPNGTSFPDVAGRHSSNHTSFACNLCHGANGSGQTTHGPSGRTVHGDANVVIQFTGIAAGVTYTRSGLGDGHGTCSGTCSGEGHSGRNW